MQASILRIALTVGEPAGIGPDLVVQLAQLSHPVELVAIADPKLLAQRAQQLALPLDILSCDLRSIPIAHEAGILKVLPMDLPGSVICGKLDPVNADHVLATLRRAVQGCEAGEFAALVTGPVHKGIINDAGIDFTGHTEYLAQLTRTTQAVMMLTTPGLRVALATTHLPLAEISQAITADHLQRILTILHHDLVKRLGIVKPRILVSGLNPHAGEQGHLGREEIEIIEPVLRTLRHTGMQLQGPLPADTLFLPKYLEQADAVLVMYHDQGLPVLKYRGFNQAVNITLGLPIIRTSVDHGTALELAGTGAADTGSLEAALSAAIEMASRAANKLP